MGAVPIAVLFADHHAGGGWANRGLRGDADFSLDQIVKYVQANADTLEHVISLGDAADRQRNRSAGIVPLKNKLRQFVDAGVKFEFIQGNHDYDDPPWLADPLFEHVDRAVVDICGVQFYGLDYRPRGEIQAALEQVPHGVEGLLMHQGWADFMGDMTNPQCEIAEVSAVSMIVSGDNHKGYIHEVRKGREGQDVRFLNPGSTNMQEIAEPAEKFFTAFMSDGSFRRLPLMTRLVMRTSFLQSSADLDQFLQTVRPTIDNLVSKAAGLDYPEELYKPLIQVHYSPSIPNASRRIEAIVKDAASLFWKVPKPEEATRKYTANLEAAGGQAFTPGVMLKHEIVPGPDDPYGKEALNLAERLVEPMTRDQIETTIARWRQEYLET